MKLIKYYTSLVIFYLAISCDHKTDVETSEQVEMTGEWGVSAYINSTFIDGPFRVTTAVDPFAGNGSISIQDSVVKFWDFKVKAAVDKSNGTFGTELSQSELSDKNIGVKIPIGKIINSDSIYFEIQFEDDETPYGYTYQIKGRRI